jgi:hypothetical protein
MPPRASRSSTAGTRAPATSTSTTRKKAPSKKAKRNDDEGEEEEVRKEIKDVLGAQAILTGTLAKLVRHILEIEVDTNE